MMHKSAMVVGENDFVMSVMSSGANGHPQLHYNDTSATLPVLTSFTACYSYNAIFVARPKMTWYCSAILSFAPEEDTMTS